MRKATCWTIAGAAMAAAWAATAEESVSNAEEKSRPALFKRFGDHVNVPDGLAQDRQGNIFCAAPNFVDPSYAGTIMKMDKKSGKWSVFVAGLLHPETKRGAPMGMEFDEDGNLYYCDNQYFFDKNYKSRVIRVVVDPASGEPLRMEPVVENVKLANALRIRGNAVYFTDTFFDIEGKNQGGVYRVPMSAFKERPARLLPKEQAANDPYCIGVTATTPHHRKDIAATDGMCFDKDGNIYTGNFGDGHFYVLKLKADGNYEKPQTLLKDAAQLPCVDGVCYYAKKEWVFIADSERNAVLYWDIKAGKLGTLWSNDDTCGADGLLDQPCEPMVWGDKLIVANFDMTFPGLKNSKNDAAHTLSVIGLEKKPFWKLW